MKTYLAVLNLDHAQEDIPRILDILTSIPEPKMRSMQLHLSRVWHRWVGSMVLSLDIRHKQGGTCQLSP